MKVVHSVLIVDDNPFDVELASRVLSRTGQFRHIYSVTDGAEALALFREYEESCARFPGKFPPLVILLDINMPVMNGFEFLDGYAGLGRQEDGTSLVVMLTSSSFDKDRERAINNPLVQDYIVKPITRKHAHALAEKFGLDPGSGDDAGG